MAQYQSLRHQDDRSLQELWSDMTSEAGTLVRKEIELAKLEAKESATRASKAGVMFGAGGVVALLALQLLSFAAAWGLAAVLPTGFAFLIVGVVYVVIAAALFSQGRKRAAEVKLVPEQTVETLKEDVQWARAQRN
ncbi:MAG: phage holin family protein [Actinobacteria bacterium]|nr:phage holin family protein [Actinomycetota bacterium]